MRRIFFFITLLISIHWVVSGCSEKDVPLTSHLELSKSSLHFNKNVGEQIVTSKSREEVSVSSDKSWCQVFADKPSVGGEGYLVTKIIISVDGNDLNESREAKITVKSGSKSEFILITQSQNEALIVKKSEFLVSYLGEDVTVDTQSNVEYKIEINVGWINKSDTKSLIDKKENFIVSQNNTSAQREGKINFIFNDLVETVTVTQEANNSVEMKSDAMSLISKMTIGWNLGNSLEATSASDASETMWGNPKTTKELIDLVKNSGFNAIRIPCAWNAYIEDESTYKVKESWLNRVQEVVDYCIKNDMYTIINIHWDGGWLENNCTLSAQEENNKKQYALWTQIAAHFKDYGEYLLFAGTNEPNVGNAEQMEVLNSYLQTFIDAVRNTGSNNTNRNLIIQGPSTDIDNTDKLVKSLPVDKVENRLIYEVHYYSPWNFCGLTKDESWGNMFYYWGKDFHIGDPVRDASWGEEEYLESQLQKMKLKFVDKNIPVIIGEFGAIKRKLATQAEQDVHEASRKYYLEYFVRQAKELGIVPFYWDNGAEESRLFDRNAKSVSDQGTLEALLKGIN